MLAQHRIQHLPLGRKEFIILHFPRIPLPVGDLEYRSQQVRERLVGAEDAEVTLSLVQLRHIAQKVSQHLRIARLDGTRRGYAQCMVVKVGHFEIMQQQTAVRVRIGTHSPIALRGEFGQLRDQATILIEQFLRLIAPHPVLEQRHVLGMLGIDQHRYLVRPESTFDLQPVDDLRSRPAFGRFQHDHRPSRSRGILLVACIRLDPLDLFDRGFHHGRHAFMHQLRVIAFDEERRPAATAQELFQFLALNAREHRGIADLVAIQMQDRQHRTVRHGV